MKEAMSRAEALDILCTAAEYGWEKYCMNAGVCPSRGLRTLVRTIIGHNEPSNLALSSAPRVNWWPCARRCATPSRIAWSDKGPENAVCCTCLANDRALAEKELSR